MRRRAATGSKITKLPRKSKKPGRASKAQRGRATAAVRLHNQVRTLARKLTEAGVQQAATSEVLKVISSPTANLQRVFEIILQNATRLCDAKFGMLFRCEDDKFRFEAAFNAPAALAEHQHQRGLFRSKQGAALNEVLQTRRVVHSVDKRRAVIPGPSVTLGNAKTHMAVPMLMGNELIGAIVIYRERVRPFTDKQIELVQNFAAQAVIAIENTRLLNELRQRTNDLSESLEQQTATSEVLKVISSSPGELKPVFDVMLANATRICEAKFGILFLSDGDAFRTAAMHNPPPALAEARRREPRFRPAPNTAIGRMRQTRRAVQIADMLAERGYFEPPPGYSTPQIGLVADARTVVAVPMLKDDELIGAIVIYRTEVRSFTDKQIALVQNFAAQAVIAIENTRLLSELRESLQQQTATADVLKTISRSTFDLQAVLDALVESVAKLCEADTTAIARQNGDVYELAATYGHSAQVVEFMRARPFKVERGNVVGRVVLEGKTLQLPDVQADPEFTYKDAARAIGVRTMLGVPLLRQEQTIGVAVLQRRRMEPFTAKQIELVTTFADQAVIAIENVRLFDEIRDKSRQLAEASQHKSQFLANMSHELRTPLNAILGYTELILDGIYGEAPEKAQAVLKRVESNGKHLLGLINDVLDLSKIEAGELKLSLTDYSVKDVVYNVFSAVEPLALKKKLNFKVEVPPGLPPGRGDEHRLTQVLLNLVGNAIKFTDAGEVAIKAATANGSFSVAVHDTGPGIAAADQDKLFEEFQQADNSITKAKGGTGLGLAISRRIVELHGGRLWVESSLGAGSTFTFTLPVVVEQQAKSS